MEVNSDIRDQRTSCHGTDKTRATCLQQGQSWKRQTPVPETGLRHANWHAKFRHSKNTLFTFYDHHSVGCLCSSEGSGEIRTKGWEKKRAVCSFSWMLAGTGWGENGDGRVSGQSISSSNNIVDAERWPEHPGSYERLGYSLIFCVTLLGDRAKDHCSEVFISNKWSPWSLC